MDEYIPVNLNDGYDPDPVCNTKNIKLSEEVFQWPMRQYDSVSVILRNMYDAAVVQDMLEYFIQGAYGYHFNSDDDSISLEWALCNNNIRIAFDIERKNYEACYTICSTREYGNLSEGKEFYCYSYAEIDDVCNYIVKKVKESVEYGNRI